jgi:hypothetical protein
MDLIELETRAKAGENFPEGITWEEKELFRDFRCLYFMLRSGLCTVGEARAEKAEMLEAYEKRKEFREWMIDATERAAAIDGIINKYGSQADMPHKTWVYLFELFEKCLLPERKSKT